MAVVPRKRARTTVYFVVTRGHWERVGTDRREAERLDAKRKKECKAGTFIPGGGTGAQTVRAYAEKWLDKRKVKAADVEAQQLRDSNPAAHTEQTGVGGDGGAEPDADDTSGARRIADSGAEFAAGQETITAAAAAGETNDEIRAEHEQRSEWCRRSGDRRSAHVQARLDGDGEDTERQPKEEPRTIACGDEVGGGGDVAERGVASRVAALPPALWSLVMAAEGVLRA